MMELIIDIVLWACVMANMAMLASNYFRMKTLRECLRCLVVGEDPSTAATSWTKAIQIRFPETGIIVAMLTKPKADNDNPEIAVFSNIPATQIDTTLKLISGAIESCTQSTVSTKH